MRASSKGFGVSVRGRYQGDGIGLVDDKGRVAIPAALRTTLSANAPKANGKDGGTIIIGAHPKNRCLVAYDPGYVDILPSASIAAKPSTRPRTARTTTTSSAPPRRGEAVPFDGSGRFIMPAFPRFYAGIRGHAFFYGVLDYIEIWDPDDADRHRRHAPRRASEMARFYMAEKGVKL